MLKFLLIIFILLKKDTQNMSKRGAQVPRDIDQLLQKHAITQKAEFLNSRTVPNPIEVNKAKKDRKKLAASTLTRWGGMKKGEGGNEAKQALKLLRWSNYLTGKDNWQRPNKEPLPEFYEFAEEIGSKTDLNRIHERPRKRRNIAHSMVKSILATEQAQVLVREHQTDKLNVTFRKEQSKIRKNKSKRGAKRRKRAGAGL